jgi:hypothetical protein
MRTTKESVKVKIIKYKNSSTPARIPVSAFTLATGEQKKWVYRKFVELYAAVCGNILPHTKNVCKNSGFKEDAGEF